MKNFTFGMKKLRISQTYNEGNHIPHWKNSKNYSDYPIDFCGEDGGRDIYYATVDMKVNAIRGHEQGYTDTIWLEATENCNTPLGVAKPFIMLTHWNTDDEYIAQLHNGQIIKAGTPICMEGTDGQATGNHLHIVCGDANRGTGDRLIKNSNDKWVSNGYCYRPEQIMFIDKEFTEILDTRGIDFKEAGDVSEYPFNAIIKKGSRLYDKNGNKYNKTNADRNVTVQGEYNGRYEIYGETFTPHIVYCDKSSIVR